MADLEERIEALSSKFVEVYGVAPQVIVRAPGRVNLIGEHTDYNDGYVLPIAIDRDVLVAASPSKESAICLYSMNFDRISAFSLDNISKDRVNKWSNYSRGVVYTLRRRGYPVAGANLAIQGDVPLGSGLSSSAALEVASAMTFQALNGYIMEGPEMAKLCQKSENEFVGVNCGIMDQFISRLGAKNHALFVDCRTLEHEAVPITSKDVKFIVADTLKKRGLVDSEYNTRREQCEEAVRLLSTYLPDIKALRDVSMSEFKKYGTEIPPTVRRRAQHVVSEDDRVLKSVQALKKGDVETFGKLMNKSHESLRDLYEVSCRELDCLVESAWRVPGVYGSRMTGAGFGGCTVSMVSNDAVEEFLERVPVEYRARIGITPLVYVCTPESGAEIVRTAESGEIEEEA